MHDRSSALRPSFDSLVFLLTAWLLISIQTQGEAMRRRARRLTNRSSIGVILLIGLAASWQNAAAAQNVASPSAIGTVQSAGAVSPKVSALALDNYGKLPLSFEVNHGQADGRVKFLSRGRGYSLFLTSNEAVLSLRRSSTDPKQKLNTDDSQTGSILRMKLVGANAGAAVAGAEELPGKSNYFIGNDPKNWRTNLPTYAKVKYQDVYPGVDLVYYGNQGGQLEYDFVVAPGADPKALGLDITADNVRKAVGEHAASLRIAANGDLIIKTNGDEVRFEKPVVYQEQLSSRHMVDGRYVLRGKHGIGFEVASYDHSKPLIIDPSLSYFTYLGGSGNSMGNAIAVDSSGNAYFTGAAGVGTFPTTAGAFMQTNLANGVFVAKLNANGTALLYSTILGGASIILNQSLAIAVDSSGNAYVTGYTQASDFPTTSGAFQTTLKGLSNAFVTKLNAAGSALLYSTYLGGSKDGQGGASQDQAYGIAVDSAGSAYVSGDATAANFPTTPGAFQTTNKTATPGGSNAFVTKLNPAGTALVYSTYLGGSVFEGFGYIALDSSNNAYITGWTGSTDFPTTAGAYQTTASTTLSVTFVSKLNASGSALVYSTFFGNGNSGPVPYAIAVDSAGSAYITGFTNGTLPTANAFQPTFGGFQDAFVAKFNPTGSALVYSTFLGGSDVDQGLGIAVDSAGDAYVAGEAQSTNFPTANPACGCSFGTFVAELNPAGSALVYSNYLGGGSINGIALDSVGNAYVTGGGGSSMGTAGAYQQLSTGSNAFVGRIGAPFPILAGVSPNPLTFSAQSVSTTSAAQTVTVTNTGPTGYLNISAVALGGTNSGDFALGTDTCKGVGGVVLVPGATCTVQVTFTPSATGSRTATLTFTDTATTGSPQVVTLTGTGTGPALPAVTFNPTSVAFGNQVVNTTSSPSQVVVLTNSGAATLTGIAISFTGANPTFFGKTTNCTTTLAAGASCSISVTFTPTSAISYAASLSVADNATGSPQTVPLTGTGLVAATPTPSVLVFNPVAVGVSAGSAQMLTASFLVSGYTGSSFTPTAVLHYGLSYTAGAVSCTGGNSPETCTVAVTFQPQYPGGRRDALFLMSGSARLSSVLLYGIGQAPFAMVQPGVVTQPIVGSAPYLFTSVVDEVGTAYVLETGNNATVSVTKAGVSTTLPITGLNSPRTIGVDGAGVLYISTYAPGASLITYDTVQKIQGTFPVPASDFFIDIAAGNMGNIYEVDSNAGVLYTMSPSGTSTHQVTFSPTIAGPASMAVDASEDIFVGGASINEITAAGVQTQINTNNSQNGLSVDAAGTLYGTPYTGVAGIVELSALNYSTPLGALDPSANPIGASEGPDGTVYVGNYSNLDKVDRSQGLIAFGQQSQAFGTASPQQIVTIYNGGNQTLTISNIAASGSPFSTQAAATGTTCTNGGTVAPGALCQIAVVVTPVHAGIFNGSITVTSNSLNSNSTTLTVALTAFTTGVYVTPSPTSLTFPNQIVGTTSTAQTVTLTNNGDLYVANIGTPSPGSGSFTAGLGTCTSGIAVGASCQLSVTFTPAAATSYNNILVTVPYTSSGGGTPPAPITFTVTGTGISAATPQAVISPNPLAFSSTTVGASTVLPLTLSNPGTAALAITTISVTGTSASSFGQTNTCGSSLAAGSTCIITVTFTPGSTGSLAAAISVADNATGSPHTAVLTGTGTAPQATFTSTTLTFPGTLVGTSGGTASTTISNPGTAPLTITGITITGPNATSFSQSNNCGASLAAGATCNVTVTFMPTATGSLTASLSLADNATGSPQTVALTGAGTAPQAVLSPNPLAFPSTLVGTAATALPMTLSNPGTAALTITSISVTGTNASSFGQSNNCGASLAAGATCTVTVTFTPTSVASLAASISVVDNATGSPQAAAITGTGTAPLIPQAVLGPATLTFPTTTINTSATPLPITLSNPGNTPLIITSISVTGANASSFGQTNNCPVSLAAGATCTITVTFTPASAATINATISVVDNAAGSPQSVAISGIGSAGTYVVNSATPSANIQPGAMAQFNLTIAPLGGSFNNLVTLSATGLPAGSTVSFLPPAVTPGSVGAPSVMSIQTSTGLARLALPGPYRQNPVPLLALLAGAPLLGLAAGCRRLRRSSQRWLLLGMAALAILPMLALGGCGGGYFGPPPQAYTVTVTGTSGSLQESTTVTLTVQ